MNWSLELTFLQKKTAENFFPTVLWYYSMFYVLMSARFIPGF